MSAHTEQQRTFPEALHGFLLDKQASLRAPRTLEYYRRVLGDFSLWLEREGVADLARLRPLHVRAYLVAIRGRGYSDATVGLYARGLRAYLRFCHAEGYMPEALRFDMPKAERKLKRALTPAEAQALIAACEDLRDLALLTLMLDTGLRLGEVAALTWADLDLATGAVRVRRGKGGKGRLSVVGLKTRRALLKYRRSSEATDGDAPLWVGKRGALGPSGVAQAVRRIGRKAGLEVSPHALRRTFATLSATGGMSVVTLQALMGHATIGQTVEYVRMTGADLQSAHEAAGPVDHLGGRR